MKNLPVFMTCHWEAPLVMNWKGLWRFSLQRSKLQWTSQIQKCGLPLQWLTFSSWALEQTMLCSTEWAFEWHAAVTETLWYPASVYGRVSEFLMINDCLDIATDRKVQQWPFIQWTPEQEKGRNHTSLFIFLLFFFFFFLQLYFKGF